MIFKNFSAFLSSCDLLFLLLPKFAVVHYECDQMGKGDVT